MKMEKRLKGRSQKPPTPGATGSWKRQEEFSLGPPEGACPSPHLDFERLASRTVRE